MFKLLKNGEVYAPEFLGTMDILICGNKIVKVDQEINTTEFPMDIEILDVSGKSIIPGFIDQHVHIIGGGGEAGFYSRTPEVMLSGVISSGITTLVGVIGTDGTSRHLESLLAKARGLEKEGVTTYILTGSYEIPPLTITGDVRRDVVLIDKVIGVGEIAVSDHRSSEPTKQELKRIATQSRVGGMLSGKPGIVQLHMGDGKDCLKMIFEIVEETEIPLRHFVPTHVNRNRKLFEHAKKFGKMGGYIDITSGVTPAIGFHKAIKPSKAVRECVDYGVPIEKITMSSDGNGSMAVYNDEGKVEGLMVTTLDSLYSEFKDLVLEDEFDISEAVQIVSTNVAKILGIYPQKGSILENSDADLVILDEKLNIDTVLAKGQIMLKNGKLLVKGTFE